MVSARRPEDGLAQFCASDFEDVIAETAGARIYTPLLPAAPGAKDPVGGDLAILVALSFRHLERLLAAITIEPGTRAVGYVFGAYAHDLEPQGNPLVNAIKTWRRRRVAALEALYLGIGDAVDEVSSKLNVRAVYVPMAANALVVGANPLSAERDRPIAVSAFGRQHIPTLRCLADRLNQPGSSDILYASNFLDARSALEPALYRAMFWHLLRQSKISMAFDQVLAPNEARRHFSHVGPRWFESLAAGTVVVGYAPQSSSVETLLDWKDATIELSRDPETATQEVIDLLADRERLEVASRRNLYECLTRHDWRHRLRSIIEDCGVRVPSTLDDQLKALEERASELNRS